MDGLTHFDEQGQAVMVDVSQKLETERQATASGKIRMSAAAFAAAAQGTAAKGDVLGVARIAGIQAVKNTANLIPLCHPLYTEKTALEFELLHDTLSIRASCTVRTHGKTGVEMEALTGVSVALLTIYDMCKALDKSMELYDIRLEQKLGGKSGVYTRREKDAP